ncbi:MAG: fluoride efflux transporter CrcB [Armatimonadota bacterium]
MKSFLPVVLVAVGGMLGALARYGLTIINRPGLPIGTLTVNLVGCFIMGFLARWIEVGIAKPELRFLLGIGFLGALTTFSTFSYEILHFFLERNATGAFAYLAISTIGCLACTAVGYVIARAIWI